jgi:hypothetical protein
VFLAADKKIHGSSLFHGGVTSDFIFVCAVPLLMAFLLARQDKEVLPFIMKNAVGASPFCTMAFIISRGGRGHQIPF